MCINLRTSPLPNVLNVVAPRARNAENVHICTPFWVQNLDTCVAKD